MITNGYIHPRLSPTNVAPFYLPDSLRKLKLEIDLAVWNWETRNGLPHYDGGFRRQNEHDFYVDCAKKRSAQKTAKA